MGQGIKDDQLGELAYYLMIESRPISVSSTIIEHELLFHIYLETALSTATEVPEGWLPETQHKLWQHGIIMAGEAIYQMMKAHFPYSPFASVANLHCHHTR